MATVTWDPAGITIDGHPVPPGADIVLERRDGVTVVQVTVPVGTTTATVHADVARLGSAVGHRAVVDAWLDTVSPDELTMAIASGGASVAPGAKVLAALRDRAARL